MKTYLHFDHFANDPIQFAGVLPPSSPHRETIYTPQLKMKTYLHFDHFANDPIQFAGVLARDAREVANTNLAVQLRLVAGHEGWVKGAHLVQQTTQCPDVRLVIVRHVVHQLLQNKTNTV
jgi:hypothetical protein